VREHNRIIWLRTLNSSTLSITDVWTSNVSNTGKIVASSTTIKFQDKKCAVRSISKCHRSPSSHVHIIWTVEIKEGAAWHWPFTSTNYRVSFLVDLLLLVQDLLRLISPIKYHSVNALYPWDVHPQFDVT